MRLINVEQINLYTNIIPTLLVVCIHRCRNINIIILQLKFTLQSTLVKRYSIVIHTMHAGMQIIAVITISIITVHNYHI